MLVVNPPLQIGPSLVLFVWQIRIHLEESSDFYGFWLLTGVKSLRFSGISCFLTLFL